jgi:hypothetical protein
MGNPKFKIGDRLFYKGHLHCVVMDIIQENLSFTYEVNMSLNKKNKIVDEWELFENKQQANFGQTSKKNNKPEFVPEPMLFDSEEEAVEFYSKRDKLNLIMLEVKDLKKMIANLTEIVMKQNQDVEKTIEVKEPIVKDVLQNIIDNLRVGQKKTFNGYAFNKIKTCLRKSEPSGKDFHVIEKRKGNKIQVQVYRLS